MIEISELKKLVVENDSKILFLILDGLGGIPGENGLTELETAETKNLDRLAKEGICGLMDPISPGITPGSGPAHFALFGYDPFSSNVGRGLLEASGIEFPLKETDVVARTNFATIDKDGIIVDRRAGRISTQENERICKKLQDSIRMIDDVEVLIRPVKEHRSIVVFRGDGLFGDLADTDPQREGNPPLEPRALNENSKKTEMVVKKFVQLAKDVLSSEKRANMILFRGFAKYRRYESFGERYKLRAFAIATYPMYRGICKLLGMDLCRNVKTVEEEISLLHENYKNYDFFYLHVKETDSRGEDGNFKRKVEVIEEVDRLIPKILEVPFDVIVVTGDHSTPSALKSHSWHPLPLLLHAKTCIPDRVEKFSERECIFGGLGRIKAKELMTIALAHALRLKKYGA